MELNSFARIGKGVISKSIGLQKNYKEIVTQNADVLNEQKSLCESCPIHKLKEDLRLLGLTQEAEKSTKNAGNAPLPSGNPPIRYITSTKKTGMAISPP